MNDLPSIQNTEIAIIARTRHRKIIEFDDGLKITGGLQRLLDSNTPCSVCWMAPASADFSTNFYEVIGYSGGFEQESHLVETRTTWPAFTTP